MHIYYKSVSYTYYTIYLIHFVSVVVTLTCLVGEERDSAGLQEGSKLQTTDLRVSFSSSLLEECISINSVKEMFTPEAWRQVKPMVSALKEHPLWN